MKASARTTELFTEVSLLIKSRMQKAMPLPFSQCQALGFVAERERPTMQEVARYFNITAPSATFLVDELVRAGLMSRTGSASDRRKIELSLTKKGLRAFKIIAQTREKVISGIFVRLSPNDLKDLDRVLTKIVTNV